MVAPDLTRRARAAFRAEAIQARDATTVNPALSPKDDPRVHSIGSGLKTLGLRAQLKLKLKVKVKVKVKCRPVRHDGRKGEVCTSKPSKVVGGRPVDSSQLVLSSSAAKKMKREDFHAGGRRAREGARRGGEGKDGERGEGVWSGLGRAVAAPNPPQQKGKTQTGTL